MEATPEQAAEGLAIVRVLASVLDRLVCANVSIARADPGQVTKFHAMKPPGIAIQQYLERIHKYASCSNECFILALIYIDRLIQRNNFLLTELNVHRVVITAVLMAAKFFDDAYYNNAYYAKVGGVLVSEMNGLEVDFLFRINFSLHVTPEIFEKYRAELLSHSTTATTTNATMAMQQSPIHVPQMHPEPVRPPVQAAPVPPMVTTGPMAMNTELLPSASQITPSPPREAAQVVVDAPMQNATQDTMAYNGGYTVEMFAQDAAFLPVPEPLQRTNSMPAGPMKPAPVSSYYRTQSSSSSGACCVQNSLSAPPMHHDGPYVKGLEEQYAALQNQLNPLQGTLMHFNHSGFQQQGPSGNGYGTRDGAQQMLTGMSGAGL